VSRRDRLTAAGWLLAAGIFAGLGFASKWPVFYGMVGVGLLMLWDAATRKRRSIWYIGGGVGRGSVIVLFTLVAIPLGIYLLSYVPYFRLGHGLGEWFKLQQSMLDYHASLTATHPFGSPWYGWPFGYRAVYLYLAQFGAERAEIWSIPNLVVGIGGLVAMGVVIGEAFKRRSGAIAIIALGALVQYLPWVAVTRVTFMYHYLPVIPFLCLALAWLLIVRLREHPQQRMIAIAVTAVAVVFFVALYPVLVGWQMPSGYGDAVRALIPWVI
jgi:dolichyl-phosphate-mannose--protein O-mannosyl transferase